MLSYLFRASSCFLGVPSLSQESHLLVPGGQWSLLAVPTAWDWSPAGNIHQEALRGGSGHFEQETGSGLHGSAPVAPPWACSGNPAIQPSV